MKRSLGRLVSVISVALLAVTSHLSAAPLVFFCDGRVLEVSRTSYKSGDPRMKKRVEHAVIERGNDALKLKPASVMDKAFTPPSGDKHDYMSLSPYWWPDPAQPDGKPYIRRDGEFNPERAQYDQEKMETVTGAALDLALAYYFTGDERYAEHAHELIRVWFFDPATRMNPNCEFAQFVPGRPDTRASGVIEARKATQAIDAAGLLSGSKHWSADDDAKLHAWSKEMLHYLLTSKQGKAEQKSPNNHGTWYGVQVTTYALYLGDTDQAKKLLEKYVRDRVKTQFEPDGSQPLELERTNGILYTRFNLLAHEDGALLGQQVGLDLWNYQSDDGRSIRKGLDWLMPYCTGEKKWEWKQISPVKKKETALVFRRAASAFSDPRYEAAVKKISDDGVGDLADLLYPATISGQ
jgi:hypothetical protein